MTKQLYKKYLGPIGYLKIAVQDPLFWKYFYVFMMYTFKIRKSEENEYY